MPYFSICRLAKSMMLIMPSNICHVGFPEKMPHLTIILALLKNMAMTVCSWPRLKKEGLSF